MGLSPDHLVVALPVDVNLIWLVTISSALSLCVLVSRNREKTIYVDAIGHAPPD